MPEPSNTSTEARPATQPEAPPSPAPDWHAKDGLEVLKSTKSDEDGLTSDEAADRLAEHGPNRLQEHEKEPAWWRFLRQFHDVLIYILLVAAVVTAFLGEWIDTSVIFAVVLINAIIGYVQEGKAEEALEAIRGMLSPTALVLRDGERVTLDAEEIVPGDIVFVESGDRVPADVRWLRAVNLYAEEAALTGESVPVEKSSDPIPEEAQLGDRASMGYSGTIVTRGRGKGVVVATGKKTEIGRIGELVSEVEELTTPLIKQINEFGKVLALLILGLCALTFGFGYFFRPYSLEEMFMIVVGLAVAAIPEGLPAILTITLALGVQRMAGRNAILRKLPAVETLGSVSVICSDKTGTLTKNEMTVRTVITPDATYEVTGAGYAPEGKILVEEEEVQLDAHPVLMETARAGVLCSDATLSKEDAQWKVDGDPTEGGVVALGRKAGIDPSALRKEEQRIGEVPFESYRQWMATLHETADGPRIFLKGAPERVLDLCESQREGEADTGKLNREYWSDAMEEAANKGQRLLAIAVRETDRGELAESDVSNGGFTLLGILGLLDPPRDEAITAVQECREAGIDVKMITGDHAGTAKAIGSQLGIGDDQDAVTGSDLEGMSNEELSELVPERSVFARASPEHKLRIMQALQSHGKIVAMTGDGVNDAPALKRADVGIAMGIKGAEASKQAAEMVLADDNFATIAAAVREGRTIYDNLKKAILFILPTNGAESLMLIATVLFTFEALPITPLQILWVNMVTAVTLALAMAFEPGESGIMKRPPRDPDEPILSGYLLWRIAYVSVLIAVAALWLFFYEIERGVSVDSAQTIAVNTLVAGQIAYLFNTRFIWQSALSVRRLLSNPVAWGVVGILLLLQLAFTYLPFMQIAFGSEGVKLIDWAWIIGVGVVVFFAVETEKAFMRWWKDK